MRPLRHVMGCLEAWSGRLFLWSGLTLMSVLGGCCRFEEIGVGAIGDREWRPSSLDRIISVGNQVYVQQEGRSLLNIFGPTGPGRLGTLQGQVDGGLGYGLTFHIDEDSQILSALTFTPRTSQVFTYQVGNPRNPFLINRQFVEHPSSMVTTWQDLIATANVSANTSSVFPREVVIYRSGTNVEILGSLIPPDAPLVGLTFVGPNLVGLARGHLYIWRQIAPVSYEMSSTRLPNDFMGIIGIQGRGDKLYVQRLGELVIYNWPATESLPQLIGRIPVAS